jgi:hypothetical protein
MATDTDFSKLPDNELLAKFGWHAGARDPRLNTDSPGAFMVCEPYEDEELPTRDGSDRPFCIVGDDLAKLVTEGAMQLRDRIEMHPPVLESA